jgi:pyrroloquinoline quinone (PQQ) biosynthesis protein C
MSDPAPSRPPAATSRPAGAFFEDLLAEVLSHPCVEHPFLERFATGKLDRDQLTRHATQHYLYSRWFARNLAAATAGVPDEPARTFLVQNMYEEVGEPGRVRDRLHLAVLEAGLVDAAAMAEALAGAVGRSDRDPIEALIEAGRLRRGDVAALIEAHEQRAQGDTHPALFRRYLRALGVTAEAAGQVRPLPETEAFVREYEEVCRVASWLEALGALGPGTECVVPSIYTFLLEGIQASDALAADDYLFWTIHVHCDEGHGRNIIAALEPYARTAADRATIARGARRVLEARRRWFDGLLRHVFDT